MRITTLIENTPGNPDCGHEHGLSFYIETEHHRALMDCGSTDLFIHNAEVLGIDLTQVDSVFLSHGHYDHGGGIPAFVRLNPKARIYMRETAGGDYYYIGNGRNDYIGIQKEILSYPQCILLNENLKIDPELYLFGDIKGRKFFSKDSRNLKMKIDGSIYPDTFGHEQCLVVTEGSRHVLLSGCAHNGIINILDRYREIFHSAPDAVIGGFHLIQSDDYSESDVENIRSIAYALKSAGSQYYTGHCTGEKAYAIMKEILGPQLHALHSGTPVI